MRIVNKLVFHDGGGGKSRYEKLWRPTGDRSSTNNGSVVELYRFVPRETRELDCWGQTETFLFPNLTIFCHYLAIYLAGPITRYETLILNK